MPETPRGLEFPDSAGSTEIWTHLQNLAESADTAIGEAQAAALAAAIADAAAKYALVAHIERFADDGYYVNSIPGTSPTPIVLPDQGTGDDGISSPGGASFDILHDGLYLITMTITFEGNANGNRFLTLEHNATEIARARVGNAGSGGVSVSMSKVRRAEAGDSFQPFASQSSGVPLDLIDGEYTRLEITRIGA